ncbi:MAG: Ig-like domain-containing protein [Acidimicrobiia bacterium]
MKRAARVLAMPMLLLLSSGSVMASTDPSQRPRPPQPVQRDPAAPAGTGVAAQDDAYTLSSKAGYKHVPVFDNDTFPDGVQVSWTEPEGGALYFTPDCSGKGSCFYFDSYGFYGGGSAAFEYTLSSADGTTSTAKVLMQFQ